MLRFRSLPLLLLVLVALPGASASGEPPPALPSEGRVLIAPLNLGIRLAPELEPGVEPVWNEMLRLFEQRTPSPASLAREGAAALWADVVKARPAAGAGADVYAAYARFVRRVAEQVSFDAIVIPALVVRPAKVDGVHVSWDGVFREVDAPPIGTSTGIESSTVQLRGRGAMSAASLHVAVLAPDGELRFEGAGGLVLLQRLVRREGDEGDAIAVAEHPAPFSDTDALREGVRTAFERPLPASSAD